MCSMGWPSALQRIEKTIQRGCVTTGWQINKTVRDKMIPPTPTPLTTELFVVEDSPRTPNPSHHISHWKGGIFSLERRLELICGNYSERRWWGCGVRVCVAMTDQWLFVFFFHPYTTVQNRVLCTFLVLGFVWGLWVEWAIEISRNISLKGIAHLVETIFAWSALLLISWSERARRCWFLFWANHMHCKLERNENLTQVKRNELPCCFVLEAPVLRSPATNMLRTGGFFANFSNGYSKASKHQISTPIVWMNSARHVHTFHVVSKDFKTFHLGSVWKSKKLIHIKLCSAL